MILLFAVALTGISSSLANQLPPGQWRPLIDHLTEVNKEWSRQSVDLPDLQILTRFDNDRQRIQTHLRLVEKILREKKTPGLTPAQKINRLLRLDELRTYWQDGVFPQNTFHPTRQPYFIDMHGTACAVGYLMLQSDSGQTAYRISKENNYAYVRELTGYPELLEWAEVNGFTVDELAWIQPGYPPAPQEMCAVGNGGGANGIIHVMYHDPEYNMPLIVAGNFTEIDGVKANSIASWNGNEWNTYDGGVIGDIYCVRHDNGRTYVGGNFTLPGYTEPVNVAYFKDGQWHPMQIGDMEGSVKVIEVRLLEVMIGGTFKKVGGLDIAYLARWKLNTQMWDNSGMVNGNITDGVLSVDAPVYSFAKNGSNLLVGGDFQTLMPDTSPTSSQFIAYWNFTQKKWVNTFYGPYQPVRVCSIYKGYMVLGGHLGQQPGFAYLDAGVWIPELYYYPAGDSLIHGFMHHNNRLIMYGGFETSTFDHPYKFYISEVLYEYEPSKPLIGFLANNTVRAAASYDGYAYFAGDFTEVNNQPFNGLFCSPLTGVTPVQETENQEFVKVFQSNGYLNLRCDDLPAEATLIMFNLHGQPLKEVKLSPGEVNVQIPLTEFPGGIYFYQMQGKNLTQTGKFVK